MAPRLLTAKAPPGAGLSRPPKRSSSGSAAATLTRVRHALAAWYAENRRILPWREKPTPYRVWVSEIMLQQTRVDVVVPYFEAFLLRFPTLSSLAVAPLEKVLEAWSGLGYYRRARHLHAGARFIAEKFNGVFPRRLDEALLVPGIGRYTAGAILSIAYGVRAPIVDGNVVRVFSRILGIEGDPTKSSVQKQCWDAATEWIREGDPSLTNQMIMEFGALVCLPRGAKCGQCPVADHCVALRTNRVDELPNASKKRATVEVTCTVLLVREGQRYLLRRRGADELLPGLWDLPGTFAGAKGDSGTALEGVTREVSAALGPARRWKVGEALGRLKHSVTYRRISLEVWEGHVEERGGSRGGLVGGGKAQRSEDAGAWRWVTREEAFSLALSAPARRILQKWGSLA